MMDTDINEERGAEVLFVLRFVCEQLNCNTDLKARGDTEVSNNLI